MIALIGLDKKYCRGKACAIGLFAALLSLSACGPATVQTDINDPNEVQNRRIHEWNKDFDRRYFGGDAPEEAAPDGVTTEGLSDAAVAEVDPYDAGSTGPGPQSDAPVKSVSPLLIALKNFGTNLDNPRRVLNSLLQVRPGDAAHNTLRFGINSTIGIGGIFDMANAAGLPEIDTNFSETMHVWGVPEGNFQELPVFGPSTQRDTAGAAVDFVINPLWYGLQWPANLVANGFVWAGEATDRVRYSETVDSLYYDSEDSYSQQRLIYLQNRRFELRRGEVAEEDYEDPYEDIYSD